MESTCLTVDLGTSWAKVATYALSDARPHLLHSQRLPSGAGSYNGSPGSIAAFLAFCAQLQTLIDECLETQPVTRLGLTGIREGLVLLDAAGQVVWVSGNALLDNEIMLDRPIGGIDIGGFIPAILAQNGSACVLLSLQGYLAYRITGRMAITGSEMDALALLRDANLRCADAQRLLQPVSVAAVGASLGPCLKHPDTRVYLAGTDEHASHHGAGIGTDADLALATATFWSLTAPATQPSAALPEVRYIPPQPPYCASASIIGYRFGPYLQEALAGEVPAFPDRLPLWAVGSLLDYLRNTTSISRERLLECVVADIQSAQRLLSQVADIPAQPTIAVHGGGLTRLRDFTVEVMERLGHRWIALEGDATQIGCCLAAQD